MSEPNHPISLRLTPECRRLIVALAKRLGLKRSSVVEVAVREAAKKEKIK